MRIRADKEISMGKHAYLIMAHNNFDLLAKLLELIDDDRNDIYIHIDVKAGNFDKNKITRNVVKSSVYFTERIDVKWAAVSGIICEMILLQEAVRREEYDYYHLLSGVDLPIKSQTEIHRFFDEHKGTEFVEYDETVIDKNIMDRVAHYYFFQDVYGRNRKNIIMALLYIFDNISDRIQALLHINRVRNIKCIWQKGPNWFSITHNLAKQILGQKEWIERTFKYTRSGDELFVQTILCNSFFKNNVYKGGVDKVNSPSLRKIDWTRGKPYTWRKNDYNELINDEAMFARKFSPDVDNDIITLIYDEIMERQKNDNHQ